jgi:enamine deaminase RidA (YjgF/YER057c/UK114 family)
VLVEKRFVSSGSPYEQRYGYSRAVVAGPHVYVAGTAPIMADGSAPPDDAYGQAKRCFEIISAALAEAGASPDDVVRTRVFITSAEHLDGVMRAHKEAFAEARPANTAVVTQLVDPRWFVEIEVEALRVHS